MTTYDRRQRIFKYLYKYNGNYCLVDVALFAKDLSIPSTSKNMIVYYTGNVLKKFKLLKKNLIPRFYSEYFKDISETIGHITPLAASIEMIDNCKKYSIMSDREIQEMEEHATIYSKKHKINTTDYSSLQKMISEQLAPLYSKYRQFVLPEKKRELYVYDIRTIQISEKVSKRVITLRNRLKFDCSLFPVNVNHIEYLYDKSMDALLDPYQMYNCIKQACDLHNLYMPVMVENIFTKENYKIKSTNENTFILLRDKIEIKQSKNLKKLQRIVLIGK